MSPPDLHHQTHHMKIGSSFRGTQSILQSFHIYTQYDGKEMIYVLLILVSEFFFLSSNRDLVLYKSHFVLVLSELSLQLVELVCFVALIFHNLYL